MAVGPEHLVAAEARGSRRRAPARRSRGGARAEPPSTATTAPTACAASMSCRSGVIVPRAFDMPVTDEHLRALGSSEPELRQVEQAVVGERDVAQASRP